MTYPVFLSTPSVTWAYGRRPYFTPSYTKTLCYSEKHLLDANALLLACATAGLACQYYLTTCCSVAGTDRLAWVGKSLCIVSIYQRLCHADSYHVGKCAQEFQLLCCSQKTLRNFSLVNGTTPQTWGDDYRQNKLIVGTKMTHFHLMLVN